MSELKQKPRSYSNDDILGAVEKIRMLNGQDPIMFRGYKDKFFLEFQDMKKKKVYYDVRVIMKFIDDLDRMEEEYFSGNIGRMKSIYEKDPAFNNDDNGGGDIS